jgi:hypothetical protein
VGNHGPNWQTTSKSVGPQIWRGGSTYLHWLGEQVGIGDPPSAKEAVEAAHINIAVAISSRTIFFI